MLIVLVTGGARSGKSRFAEQYAARLGSEGIYVATAEALDEEMRNRIEQHVLRRSRSAFVWETREAPYELAETLEQIRVESRSAKARQRVVLVDCLTLWLSNWLLRTERDQPEKRVREKVEELVGVLGRMHNPVLLVSNEVGDGVVPEYPLGRLYRDLVGRANQRLAEISRQVFLVTAGIPVELKGQAFRFDEPD